LLPGKRLVRDQEKRVFDVRFADETKKEFRKLGLLEEEEERRNQRP
jgi:hypothetical protein